MKNSRLLLILILCGQLLFVLYYLILSFHNRPCSDDLYFYANLTVKGWFHSISGMEMNIRWAGYLLFNTVFLLQSDFEHIHNNIFIFDLFSLALILFSVYRLFREISLRLFEKKVPFYFIMLTSMVFVSAFYFSTSQAAECWLWTIASVLYLIPLALFGLGTACLISGKKTLLNDLCTALCFFYIGGAIENIALIVIVFLLFAIIYKSFYRKNSSNSLTLLLIALISCSVLFVIQIFSEGISNRIGIENKGLTFDWWRIYQVLLQFKSLVFVLFLSLAFILGQVLRTSDYIMPVLSIRKMLYINLIAVVFTALLTFLPLLYVFGNLGPERAWIPLNYMVCASFFFWSFYYGNKLAIKNRNFSIIKYIMAMSAIVVMSLYVFRHYPQVSAFSKAYDERTALLINHKLSGTTTPVYCEKLPDPGPLPAQELNNYDFRTNKGLERAMQLPFKVYLK